ncbi:MAG: HAMP domain-containing sensor histidine kinase [Gammaproteobacteria bacterium]
MRLNSLYGRIAAVYLLLLLVFGGLSVWITTNNSQRFVEELTQKLQHNLAANLAQELGPALKKGAKTPAVAAVARRLHTINPSLELYVLDAHGDLVAYLMGKKPLARHQVAIAPLKAFIAGDRPLPIQGDDPSETTVRKIFSVAQVELGPAVNGHYAHGYLYVILHGMPYASEASMLQSGYFVRTGVMTLAVAVVFAAVIGLLLFALMTRRFRRLTATVRRFKAGEHGERVRDAARDEIGQLGQAFDEMATTIQAQVEALEQTDATRRELVANVTHDLRTPLTSLRGYTERLAGRELSTEDRRECLDAILINTVQLERLIGQLSLLSRLDARRLAPNFEPFSPAELAQDLIVKFKPAAEAKGIVLGADYDQGLPAVRADVGLVERALANLIDNALTNTPQGGRVEVQLLLSSDRVQIIVTDTGYGIAEHELALVTQRFYRAARSRVEDTGSGLGLSITSEVAVLHGSRLTLSSRIGAGTEVAFDLPLA